MKRKLAALLAVAGVIGAAAFYAIPSQAATTQLYTLQTCLPDGSVRVDFSWQGNDRNATQQWLDLSLFNNNWQWGTFLGAGPMPGSQNALRWDGLIPGVTHFVRVNQQLANGAWDPSGTFYFDTRACTPATPPNSSDRARVPAPIDDARVVKTATGYDLEIQAGLPSGCALRDGHETSRTGNEITVKVWNTLPTDNRPCTAIYGMYDLTIQLGNLTPGVSHTIRVNDKVLTFTP
jgi:hypothetical protein